MRWKTTVLLLAATIAIGAYISLYEIRQPSSEERERLAQQILNISPESVGEIALEMPSGHVAFIRAEATWRIRPSNVRADGDRISELLNAASSLYAERLLSGSSDHPLNPATYGLNPPVGRMVITAHGIPTILLFGDATAVHSNRYMQIAGHAEIAVVPSHLFDLANQPSEAFRDPRFIRFSPWLIDEFAVTGPSGSFTLACTNNVWRLVQPFADRAARTEVNGLLDQTTGMRIRRFIADSLDPAQRASYGLEPPQTEVRIVQHQPATSTTVLAFGKAVPGAGGTAATTGAEQTALVYATRSDEPGLYAVDAADVEALHRDPHGLRSKTCLEFLTPLITKIAVMRQNHEWTIERVEGQWKTAGTAQPLEAERVETFITQLSELQLGGFVEDHPTALARYGLDTPYGTISVWSQDQPEPQRVLIGAAVEGSADRYGLIADRGAIVRLPDTVAQLLATTPEQLRPMTPDATTLPPLSATPRSK